MNDLSSIMNKKEPLCSELKNRLFENDSFQYISHPLVISVPYMEETNALLNKQLEVRKDYVVKKLQKKDFEGYIFMHEKPYRLDAFLKIMNQLSDKSYWGILRDIWQNIENNWQNLETWKELMQSNRKHREFFMEEEERDFLNTLPETFTIYRGHTFNNENGFSYTLDIEKAKWFSKRFSRKGAVSEKVINKSDVFAYLSSEQEIIYIK